MESLDIAIEDLGNLKRKITVTVPKDKVKDAYNKCYLSLKNKVSINGFRKGKYPQALVEKRFKKVMRDEAIEKLVPEYYERALKQENLKPAVKPEFGDLEIDKKKPLTFSASFEIFSEFEMPEISAYSLEKKEISIPDEDIRELRQRHLDNAATFEPKDGTAEEKDQVKIDFTGKLDDEVIASSNDQAYILGSKQFLPEFEAALKGMAKDEEKHFDLTFPSDYNEEKLQGKTASFKVKVNEINLKKDPELNDEFFKQYGEKVTSEKDFDKFIEDEVRFRHENEIKNDHRKKIKEQLADLLEFEVPGQLHQEEINIRLDQAGKKNKDENISDEELKTKTRKEALKDLRFSIFVQNMLDKEELKPNEGEVHKRFQLNCSMIGINPDELAKQDYGKQMYQQIFGMVSEETVLDFIIEKILEK